MKVLSVVGARPQFVKLAPIAAAFADGPHQHLIVHTGQHYDPGLSEVFFAELGIPAPDNHLGVGSGSHGAQTGAILAAMDPILDKHEPDWVLVYGDTNSTLAAAISAVKLHLPVAHLEAGLRSFNRRMPEEHNRVLTDHAADLLLAPTQIAMGHLAAEGLAGRSVLVGDVMVDVLHSVRADVAGEAPALPDGVDPNGEYLVATIHRAENTDEPRRLAAILASLAGLPLPVVLLVHPRLAARAEQFRLDLAAGALAPSPALPYRDMVRTVLGSRGVVTDSGGLQKEAFGLGVLCTTLRTETEWPETVTAGWNVLAPDLAGLRELVRRPRPLPAPGLSPYGDGTAAQRVVAELEKRCPGRDHD
jgi:UDP-N-acetylglucosamine 2-epimerase (non-hydrolysing)